MLAVAVALLASCADPRVATPADEHATRDRLDGDALARHVEIVPGVVRASAWLRRPFVDPLGPAPRDPGRTTASIAIVVAGDADRAAVEARVGELARQALAAEPAPEVTVLVSAALPPPPTLTRVGPFQVRDSSRRGLVATLAIALIVIAGLASWIVVIELRKRRDDSSSIVPRA